MDFQARPSASGGDDSLKSAGLAVCLAVRAGGDGWESNPPGTPQQGPANGFEDRGEHQLPYIPGHTLPGPGFEVLPDSPDEARRIHSRLRRLAGEVSRQRSEATLAAVRDDAGELQHLIGDGGV